MVKLKAFFDGVYQDVRIWLKALSTCFLLIVVAQIGKNVYFSLGTTCVTVHTAV